MNAWPFEPAELVNWQEILRKEVRSGQLPSPFTYEDAVVLRPVYRLNEVPVAGSLAAQSAASFRSRLQLAPQENFGLAAQAQVVTGLQVDELELVPPADAPLFLDLTLPSTYNLSLWTPAACAALPSLPATAVADLVPPALERGDTLAKALSDQQSLPARVSSLVDTVRLAAWGASAAQQLAWGRAAFQAYPNSRQWHLAVDSQLLLSVAKLRAARQIVHQLGLGIELVAYTDRATWSGKDPNTNLIRQSLQAFAAVVGGCDVLVVLPHVPQYDATALRLCATLPHLLRHEVHAHWVHDALAGAPAIEDLTRQLLAASQTYTQAWQAQGGFAEAWDSGTLPAAIRSAAKAKLAPFQAGGQILVGISRYQPESEALGRADYPPFYPPFDAENPLPHPWSVEATLQAS